jgi:FAD/FMN-containing dehydrogenase
MSVRAASEAVGAIIGAGVLPAALEMIDQATVRAVESSVYAAGYPTDAAAVLLVELDGEPDRVAADTDLVAPILRAAGARDIRSATEPAERARLWQGRKKAFGAMGRVAPDLVVQDAVVPRSALPDVLDTIAEIGVRHRLTICNVFHAGDGNLHPNICFDRRDAGLVARVREASHEIMRACVDAGGSITGEHGVGAEKAAYMAEQFGPDDLETMARVRGAFDGISLMNPGKVFPTPRLCGEKPGLYRPHPAEVAGLAERW